MLEVRPQKHNLNRLTFQPVHFYSNHNQIVIWHINAIYMHRDTVYDSFFGRGVIMILSFCWVQDWFYDSEDATTFNVKMYLINRFVFLIERKILGVIITVYSIFYYGALHIYTIYKVEFQVAGVLLILFHFVKLPSDTILCFWFSLYF